MTSPTTTNAPATNTDNTIKTVGDDIIQIVEDAILSDVPALGFPVLKQIWEALFTWISGYFIRAAETGATFIIIDHEVSGEETSLSQALQALIAAEKTGDQNAIKTAIENYAKAQSALINDNGSATAS
jgi:hypothetical protein